MKPHLEARLLQTKRGATKSLLQLHIELYFHGGFETPRSISGTKNEILSYIRTNLPKEVVGRAERAISTLIDEEIGFLVEEAKTPSHMAILARKTFENKKITSFRLKPSSTFSTLEILSSIATFSWHGKQILFDTLSSPLSLEALIEKDTENKIANIELFLKRKNTGQQATTTALPQKSISFIMAAPHLVLHGTLLQKLHEDISWKSLKIFSEGNSLITLPLADALEWIEDIESDEETATVFQLNVIEKSSCTQEKGVSSSPKNAKVQPIPLLKFHDTRGLIASLFMEYQVPGEAAPRLLPFNPGLSPHKKSSSSSPTSSFPWRDETAEQLLEDDLLSTGFERSTFDEGGKVSFRYFCPTEKTQGAIDLLLSVGWRLIDINMKPIFRLTHFHLEMEHGTTQNHKNYIAKGKVEIDRGTQGNDPQKNWSDLSFFQSLEKMKATSSPFASLEGYSLFLPLDARESLFSFAQEIEVSSQGTVSISPLKRGILNSDLPSVTIMLPHEPQDKHEDDKTLRLIPFIGTLRTYQETGVEWIQARGKKGEPCILADEMGLGKTVQILSWISKTACTSSHTPSRFLILTPKSLLFNWKKECEKFLPTVPVYLYQGEGRDSQLKEFMTSIDTLPHILLCSFHTVRSDLNELQSIPFSAVIVDEAQTVKNPESMAFQAISSLSKDFTILLTGTPFENSMKDIWGLFHLLSPSFFGPLDAFLKPFTLGSSEVSIKALKRVKKLIEPFLLRRTKEEVATELPEIIEETVFVDMEPEDKKRYLSFLAAMKQGMVFKRYEESASSQKKHRMEIFEAITRLRQIVCHHELFQFGTDPATCPPAKWALFFNDLETLIMEKKKVIIFSQFSSIIDRIVKEASSVRGWKGVSYHGSMKDVSLEASVHAFQNDPSVSFFATTLKSGGTGLNLTKGDAVLLYDPWWNRAVENQAIARAHRIGREGNVIVKRYITHESIEERVYEIAERKKELFHQLFSTSDIDENGNLSHFDEGFHHLLQDLYEGELQRDY